MDEEDNIWVERPRASDAYIKGVNAFLRNAFTTNAIGSEMRCPCKKCQNHLWHSRDVIYEHLICIGPAPTLAQWMYESSIDSLDNTDDMDCHPSKFGDDLDTMLRNTHRDFVNEEDTARRPHERMNAKAQKFRRLVEEGKQPLFSGCTNFTTLSFMVRLYHVKCKHGMTESCFSAVMDVLREAFPFANVPKSFKHAKNTIRDLGLDYQKIHCCPNHCMLYWGVNENEEACTGCGLSRWKVEEQHGVRGDMEGKEKAPKIPAKVMRYFPLIPRLQRMFMSKELSQLMRWHGTGRKRDGKLRHAADGEAWKAMDAKYPHFSSEIRNVRLGVAADGFNPFRTMSISHSTWPIILVNYNLPPWLSMKAENLILSTLISGPDSPGNNIDVYMQPLITELKELWDVGVETFDVMTNDSFTLYASVLWTISDFPGYGMLSGWSTKGKLACPSCNHDTTSMYLKYSKKMCYMGHRKFLHASHKYRFDTRRFNGKIEMGKPPTVLSGEDIATRLSGFDNAFGKKKRKCSTDDVSPWKKKSIFFELPYWSSNLLRHNLDVMHIEKNIFDNIVGTLLDISGKTKDHFKARQDLQLLGIRKDLHPILCSDGENYEYRAACFHMTNSEKEAFCSFIKSVKIPYGCASNVSRCVNLKEKKLSGYKSHDAHFILHYLLQFAIQKSLKPEVAIPLIRLSAFFRGICKKVIDLEELKKLQLEIVEILCDFETTYPPSFFDIMVHLPIHLCSEVELGGPVFTRWMFTIEQYLGKLKSYVRNRSKPEASIAEGYLAEECLTFCSRFLGPTATSSKYSVFRASESPTEGYPLGTRGNNDGKLIHLDDDTFIKAHRYVLFNCANEEIAALAEEHRVMVDNQVKSRKYKIERTHSLEFHKWLKETVRLKDIVSRELSALAKGPNRVAKRFRGYALNGYRFHTKYRDAKTTTQNSGVFMTALTNCFATSKDNNPVAISLGYYGSIEEILEVDYWGAFNVILFRCCWFQHEKNNYGFDRVNFNRLWQKNEPFVMASQVEQVFYVADHHEKGWHFVVNQLECRTPGEEDLDEAVLNDTVVDLSMQLQVDNGSWSREDVPLLKIPVSTTAPENFNEA